MFIFFVFYSLLYCISSLKSPVNVNISFGVLGGHLSKATIKWFLSLFNLSSYSPIVVNVSIIIYKLLGFKISIKFTKEGWVFLESNKSSASSLIFLDKIEILPSLSVFK
nr:unnamed protein product [Callosobruchus chinensis]